MKLDVTPSSFSKFTIIGMLIVSIGAELLLFFSRNSYFMGELYMYVLLASIFLAVPLHRKFKRSHTSTSFTHILLQYCNVFLIYASLAIVINLATENYLNDFSVAYEENTNEHLEYAPSYPEDSEVESYSPVNPFWENVDYYGSSFFQDLLAGLEEVSRLSYMLLFLMLCSVIFPKRIKEGKTFPFYALALFFSSLMFGVGHVLPHYYTFTESVGSIVYYTHAGLIFGILLLWTRNLWMLIAVHATYNFSISFSLFFWEDATFYYFLFVLVLSIVLSNVVRRTKQPEIEQIQEEL